MIKLHFVNRNTSINSNYWRCVITRLLFVFYCILMALSLLFPCIGLTCEGIYRRSGVKSQVQALKDAYNKGLPVPLQDYEPHVVTGVIKQFLRELPEPVLTTELAPKFEQASSKCTASPYESLYMSQIIFSIFPNLLYLFYSNLIDGKWRPTSNTQLNLGDGTSSTDCECMRWNHSFALCSRGFLKSRLPLIAAAALLERCIARKVL